MKQRRTIGLTLIEFIVWAALAVILLAAASFFFIRLLSYTRVGLLRGEAHANASLIVSRVSQELSGSNGAGVAWQETGDPPSRFVLSLHPADGATNDQQPTFQRKLHVFRWDSDSREVVHRDDTSITLDPLVPFRPSVAQLDQLALAPRNRWQLLGKEIVEFRLTNLDPNVPSSRVQDKLRLDVKAQSADPHREYHLTTTVVLRSSF